MAGVLSGAGVIEANGGSGGNGYYDGGGGGGGRVAVYYVMKDFAEERVTASGSWGYNNNYGEDGSVYYEVVLALGPVVEDLSFNLPSFDLGNNVVATATAVDPQGDFVAEYDFWVLDGVGSVVFNPPAQASNVYSFAAEGAPGLWQVNVKAKDEEGNWGYEFIKEVFVNDPFLAVVDPGLLSGVYDNTKFSAGSVVLSAGETTGTYTTIALEQVNFSRWGLVTYSATTPGDSILIVDVLDATDSSVLVSNIKSGQNISGLGATSIKLRAKFIAGSSPSLGLWDASYYTQFKVTVTNCSNPYSGEVTALAVRASDSEEFGPFTGSSGQILIEVPPGIYNIKACIPAFNKCSWGYGTELV